MIPRSSSRYYLIMDVVCGDEGFGARRAALLLPSLAGGVGELALQLEDLVLELLDVIDCVRQGGLLAHLKTTGKQKPWEHVRNDN